MIIFLFKLYHCEIKFIVVREMVQAKYHSSLFRKIRRQAGKILDLLKTILPKTAGCKLALQANEEIVKHVTRWSETQRKVE